MTASDSISAAVAGVEQLLIDSLTFQRSVAARDADAARQRVHWWELDQLEAGDLPAQLPAAVLILENHHWRLIGQGVGHDMGASGSVVAILLKDALASLDPKETMRDWHAWLGCVLDECSDLCGKDTYFPFLRIEVLETSRASTRERATRDYFAAAVLFSHDIDGEA